MKKGDEELASMNYWNDHDWFFKLRRGLEPLPESCLVSGSVYPEFHRHSKIEFSNGSVATRPQRRHSVRNRVLEAPQPGCPAGDPTGRRYEYAVVSSGRARKKCLVDAVRTHKRDASRGPRSLPPPQAGCPLGDPGPLLGSDVAQWSPILCGWSTKLHQFPAEAL